MCLKDAGLSIFGRVASSARRREREPGWARSRWKIVRSRMAVVSEPAVMLEVVHAVRALFFFWNCCQPYRKGIGEKIERVRQGGKR